MLDFLRAKKAHLFRVTDALLSATALLLAFLLRFDGTVPAEYFPRLPVYLAIFVALNLLFLHREHLYSFTWSFVGLNELSRLFRALTYAGGAFALLVFLDRDTVGFFAGFPRSTI